MKKILLLVAFMVSAAFVANAQSFGSESRYVGLGLGVGGGYGIPVSAFYEQAVHEHVGVGATIAYAGTSEGNWNYSNLLIGVRANYHFLEHIETGTNWDTYGGVILGYNIVSASWDGTGIQTDSASASELIFGVQIGARYCFNSSWAAFGEIGYGIGVLTVGATYSF
ncbi:MAG: outer membrane beta-barrel protein [Rikenellaceae bacterium]